MWNQRRRSPETPLETFLVLPRADQSREVGIAPANFRVARQPFTITAFTITDSYRLRYLRQLRHLVEEERRSSKKFRQDTEVFSVATVSDPPPVG